MVGIHWAVFGDEVLRRDLLRFEGRVVNAAPAFVAIVEDIKEALGQQFDSEGRHASGGWAPLADETLARKAAEGLDQRILHATQDLMMSLTGETEDTMVKIGPELMEFGTDLDYAGFHQTGTVNMPQRRPIEFTEVDKVEFMRKLQRYMVEGDISLEGLT